MDTPIVVLDDAPAVLEPHDQFQRLKDIGKTTVFHSRPRSKSEVIQRANRCHTLVLLRHHIPFDSDLLANLSPHLRHLAVWGTGLDHVDIEAATKLGIAVSHTPGTSTQSVAEHCLTLLLVAMRSVHQLDATLRSGSWPSTEMIQLSGKVMGIIGTGRIGRRVAEIAVGLGMKVLAWSYHQNLEEADRIGFDYLESLTDVLAASDAVSLHLRASPQSFHIIGKREIASMKKGAILINTARGSLIDEAALVTALQSGHMRAAGLDVFEEEPLPADHALLKLPNAVLTPHIADKTPEAVNNGMELLVDNILEFIKDGHPRVHANPQ